MPRYQQIIICETETASERDDCIGWDSIDGSIPVQDPVGLTPSAVFDHCYKNVLTMLHKGWRLMAPPIKIVHIDTITFEWWLTRTVDEHGKVVE